LEITQEKSYFVRPRRWDISPKCTALTGITKDDIQSAPPFAEVLAEFINTFDPKNKLCGTWGEDADLVQQACHARGLKSPLRYLVDIAHLFRRAFGLKDPINLQRSVTLLNLKFKGVPHSALGDARNTALVHAEIIRRMRVSPKPQPISTEEPPKREAKSLFAEKLATSLAALRRRDQLS
jgi:inhibitor of KinA sporulation pathway (predicted exonuclease)